jgi:hypothetical protein
MTELSARFTIARSPFDIETQIFSTHWMATLSSNHSRQPCICDENAPLAQVLAIAMHEQALNYPQTSQICG